MVFKNEVFGMNVQQVLEAVQAIAPLSLAMGYDNVGLLVGDHMAKVTKVVVALDATPAVVTRAITLGAELIITHHPVIFDPLKRVTAEEQPVVFRCIQQGIAVISAHTNLDSAEEGVNHCLAKALGLTDLQSIVDEDGFCFQKGRLAHPQSAEALAKEIKERLGGVVRYTNGGKPIQTVAVCGGSGGGLLPLAIKEADALVTADVKHKTMIMADRMGFSLFDAGHFHTEDTVIESFCERLQQALPALSFLSFHGAEIQTI